MTDDRMTPDETMRKTAKHLRSGAVPWPAFFASMDDESLLKLAQELLALGMTRVIQGNPITGDCTDLNTFVERLGPEGRRLYAAALAPEDEETWWAIMDPDGALTGHFSSNRGGAIRKHGRSQWRADYRRGYRCVKVRVRTEHGR